MKWSKLEIILLKANYNKATWEILLRIFPKRNKRSIKNKASQLGLKRKEFTIKGGAYINYYTCDLHGKIYKQEVTLNKGKKPTCPRDGCKRLLRSLPKKSKLRRKYREKK